MLCKLWVGEDLFAELESISVLLVLVTSLQDGSDRGRILIFTDLLHVCCNLMPPYSSGEENVTHKNNRVVYHPAQTKTQT